MSQSIRFIGDVHGKIGQYISVAEESDKSIQIGDMGVGFLDAETQKTLIDFQYHGENHVFIRGNHDDPEMCRTMNGYIEDGFYSELMDMMFVGGAWSIDHAMRTEGISWWKDEEVSTPDFYKIHDDYNNRKPKIMITHDAPIGIPSQLGLLNPFFGSVEHSTRTAQALGAMWYVHKPDIWIFGHWHKDVDRVIDGTRFICLDELSYIDLEV